MQSRPRRRWYLLPWAAGLVVLATVGSVLVRTQERRLWQSEADTLEAIATLKANKIAVWLAERLADAGMLMAQPYFVSACQRWLASPQAGDEELILDRFGALSGQYGYRDVLLVDRHGAVRMRLSGTAGHVCEEARTALQEALATGTPTLTDLHLDAGGHPHLAAVAPLPAAAGPPVAAVILEVDPATSLYPLIQTWPLPSRTGESLLVRREGDEVVFLNELLHQHHTALRLRQPLERHDLPAVRAVRGEECPFVGRDYRGVKVLAAWRAVAESPWFLIAKVDTEEVFAAARQQLRLLVGLLLAIAAAGSAAAFAAWQRRFTGYLGERLRLERELHAAAGRYQVTLASIGDAVIATDREGRVELVNPVAERLTGWSQEEAKGRPLDDVFPIVNEQTRRKVDNPVARVLREGKVVGLANHTLLLARHGREIPIADSGAPIRDADGAILGVVLVFRDQSAERAARKALQDSEEFVRRLLENLPIGVAVNSVEPTVAFHYFNDAFCRLYRVTPEQLATPDRFWAAAYPDQAQREEIRRRVLEDCASGDSARMRWEDVPIARPGEPTTYISARNVPLPGNEEMMSLVWDVTDRVQTTAKLSESEQRYRRLFLAHPEPMWVYDLESLRFLAVNDAAVAKYGYSRKEFLGMTIRDIRPPEDVPRLEQSVGASRRTPEYEHPTGWRHRTRDGSVFDVEISSNPLLFEDRQARVVVARDVGERRRLEQQLLQAQKMEAVGTLAGGIAHDFNNVLQALLATVQTATFKAADERFRATLSALEALIRRGADLIRQLMLFARQQPSQHQTVDVAALVREQAGMLGRLLPENIQVMVEGAPAGAMVEGDPTQLGQVMTNLAVNARDAMPAGGILTMAVAASNGQVVLEVRDTGHGMSKEVRGRIFDPFFTTKPQDKGTGLGLAVVWGVVQAHGGRVEVESSPGAGTAVRITLPATASASSTTSEPSSGDRLPVGAGERVLVAEDEEEARTALAAMLTELGYEVTAVASAEEARRLPAKPACQLLLTDYLLPGATGLVLADALSERWPDLAVVVMSGYAPEDLAGTMLASGRRHFLQKPFDMKALAGAMRAALNPHPPASPNA